MGRGGQGANQKLQEFSWDEVSKHTNKGDRWLVIDDQVYDVSKWALKHPGGSTVLGHYSGQDATEAFKSFHNDFNTVKKYLKPLHVGKLLPSEVKRSEIAKDFEELTNTARQMGLFKSSYFFYTMFILQVIALEVLTYFTMVYFGTGWIPFIASAVLYATTQTQAGWLQHDFGHLSVFKKSKLDHFVHLFLMGFIKGASCHWWNHMHYQHHSKPNVIGKDPDIRLDKLFVVGDTMPKEVAKERKSSMPFNIQHRYWFAIGPPLLFPIYFQYMTFRHCFVRGLWFEMAIQMTCYIKLFYLYTPLIGVGWTIFYFFILVRTLESNWFTWVTQMNHIPMEIEHDDSHKSWVELQMTATCDIDKSFFNDWFTGHLNFQIEHHLFPTMPRHNLYKVAPLVKSLCHKHGIKYQCKPLLTAFRDIVSSLEHSGQLWEHAYNEFHSD